MYKTQRSGEGSELSRLRKNTMDRHTLEMNKPTEIVAIRNPAEFVIISAEVKKCTSAERHLITEAVFDGWGRKA